VQQAMKADTLQRIWDAPVRLFHWLLVLSVVVAGVTGFLLLPRGFAIHLFAGTLVAALVLFRLVWGFAGSTYSRFRSFTFSPDETLGYARDQMAGRARHYLGHNPLGALMVAALLICLAAIVITGIATAGGVDKQGPLRGFVSFSAGQLQRGLHQIAAWGLLILIGGHLAGVIVESRREGFNLARAMVNGLKPSATSVIVVPPRWGMAAAGSGALGAFVLVPALLLWQRPAAGVPSYPLDAQYVKICGDCHIPFNPSLRTADAWAKLMASLDDHFGEDAHLPPAEAKTVSEYLAANSAEHWDTRAAIDFSREDAKDPTRITAAPIWLRRHGDLPDALFKRSKVASKSNCEACHSDARQGLFSPQGIDIPD
jgi:cytochrome b